MKNFIFVQYQCVEYWEVLKQLKQKVSMKWVKIDCFEVHQQKTYQKQKKL